MTDGAGQQKLDYYAATLSLAFSTSFTVLEKGKQHERLVWTTIGVTGRYGTGKILTTHFDASFKPYPIVKDMEVYNFQAFIAESIAF